MPELPEIETIKTGLRETIFGKQILTTRVIRRDLRFPVPKNLEKTVRKLKILDVERRSKYLVLQLSKNFSLIFHLGMSGKLIVSFEKDNEKQKFEKHDHLIFSLEGKTKLIFNDTRRFGFVDLIKDKTEFYHRFTHIGPEPLGKGFSSTYLEEKLRKSERNIKNILMDQKTVAGLGNIYVTEALWGSKISPKRLGKNINQLDCVNLVKSIKKVLRKAISHGGTSLKDFRKVGGEFGYFQNKLNAYGKEKKKCLRRNCQGQIKKVFIGGRSSFFCTVCQNK